MNTPRHPARYSPQLMPHFARLLAGYARILDPMAGTGERLRALRPDAFLNEIQPRWARGAGAVNGDALHLPFAAASFDAVLVSPTYGNRMADTFEDKQPAKHYLRNTYTHAYGAKLHPHNSGGLQWGEAYRAFHQAAWQEVFRVLREGGRFILNVSDHVRGGAVMPVTAFHRATVSQLGFWLCDEIQVATPRNRRGQNHAARVAHETIMVFWKP